MLLLLLFYRRCQPTERWDQAIKCATAAADFYDAAGADGIADDGVPKTALVKALFRRVRDFTCARCCVGGGVRCVSGACVTVSLLSLSLSRSFSGCHNACSC